VSPPTQPLTPTPTATCGLSSPYPVPLRPPLAWHHVRFPRLCLDPKLSLARWGGKRAKPQVAPHQSSAQGTRGERAPFSVSALLRHAIRRYSACPTGTSTCMPWSRRAINADRCPPPCTHVPVNAPTLPTAPHLRPPSHVHIRHYVHHCFSPAATRPCDGFQPCPLPSVPCRVPSSKENGSEPGGSAQKLDGVYAFCFLLKS